MEKIIFMTILLAIASTFSCREKPKEPILDYGQPPADIEELFTSYTQEIIDRNPENATQLGIKPEMGYKVPQNQLSDNSLESFDEFYEFSRKYKTWLEMYDRDTLTQSQALAADILSASLDQDLAGEQFKYHRYAINPSFGFHNNFISLMTENHQINTKKDVEDYISRLKKYPHKFKQIEELLMLQEEEGIIPPAYIVDFTLELLEEFVATPIKGNIFYTSFVQRVEKLADLDDEEKDRYYQIVETTFRDEILPAYDRIITQIKKMEKIATYDAGVWNLPNGHDYYQFCLYAHTSTHMTADEIHKIGQQEVERIHNEMYEIIAKLGIEKQISFTGTMQQYWMLTRDQKFRYPNTSLGKQQVLDNYQAIIDEAWENVPDLFSIQPKTLVRVEPVPDYKTNTMGAYYDAAPLDGSRKGIFYSNLTHLPYKPGMKTLTYHEAVPGHHFQIALQKENTENRMFRNFLFFTAYVEGWALYAEKLGKEQGWYDEPYELMGYLNSELFRAVRLVVDTGIHHKKWSREDAYNYMVENLGWGSYRELDRYIMWPGQACAYKIGELKILELRQKAQDKLGKKFDIKEFHSIILENGSMPLALLEKQVDEYIQHKNE